MLLGDLFSGIGGFSLAARWMGWQTAWFSEIDPHANEVLKKHWPEVPNLGDITTITNPPSVDMLVGGFPCQDISIANVKGEGIEGARSGLWSEYVRIIKTIRPRWVVAENVPNLKRKGLIVVLQDLNEIGYDAEWHCIPASYVGAPHRRDRIWIVAYPNGTRFGEYRRPSPISPGQSTFERGSYLLQSLGDSCGCGRRWFDGWGTGQELEDGHKELHPWNAGILAEGADKKTRLVKPGLRLLDYGIPQRVGQIRGYGNAIVPQVAYLIFNEIQKYEGV